MNDLRKDPRLKDNHIILNEKIIEPYGKLFSDNSFSDMERVAIWLKEQLKQIVRSEQSTKILFEEINLPDEVHKGIEQGNEFYSTLFDQDEWIPEKSGDLKINNPFSFAIERIYNTLYEIQNISRSPELTIYAELQKHIETVLGEIVARDESLNNVQAWLKLDSATEELGGFYQAWVQGIEISKLLRAVNDLIFIPTGSRLHDLATSMDYRGNQEKWSIDYEHKLSTLNKKSDWEYIRRATKGSDLFSFEDTLRHKQNLVFRCGINFWVQWLDNLKWPTLQDHAFLFIERIDLYEQILQIIVNEKSPPKTKPNHLLLIVLKNYYKCLEKISMTLFHLKEGKWNYDSRPEMEGVLEKASEQYKDWTENDLGNVCTKVFDIIFDSTPVFDSKYFDGVFEWINSLSKQNFIGKLNEVPVAITQNKLNEAFQKKLNQDIGNKLAILQGIDVKKLNWQVFGKLIDVYEKDISDVDFGNALYEKYLNYLESTNFRWNSSLDDFNDHNINIACKFSFLIKSTFSDALGQWDTLFFRFRFWHEGWRAPRSNDHEIRRKEAYVLTVGACLAYLSYKEGKTSLAQITFDKVFGIILTQHRADVHSSEDYWLPMRLLALTIAQFDSAKIEGFIASICSKVDSEQGFLVTTYQLIKEFDDKEVNLSILTQNMIQERINDRFWIVESKFDDLALKSYLQYYQGIKEFILKFVA